MRCRWPGHSYRMVVSDLIAGAHLVRGTGRTEADLDLFFKWLGDRTCRGIRLAVMHMWSRSAGRRSRRQRPQAGILYDKFHILRHWEKSMMVRKSEYPA